jgi:diguanylate cyclase (GGDEF)-like protein/PAS domain S-box-containing protein
LLRASLNTQMLLRNLLVLDDRHQVLSSARSDSQRVGLGATAAFLDQVLAQPYPMLAVSAATQTELVPEQVLYLARSAPRPGRAPLLLLAEVRVAALADLMDTGDGTSTTRVTLEHTNGQLLTTYPLAPGASPAPLQPSLPSLVPPGNAPGQTQRVTERLGHEPAWLAARPLLYPELWVSVSQPERVVLRAWRTESQAIAAIAALLAGLGISLWWGSVRHVQRMAAANAQVTDANGQLEAGNHALKRTLSLVEATLDATADAVLVINHQNQVVRFNARFLGMAGLTAEQLQGRSADWLRAHLGRLLVNADQVARVATNAHLEPDGETLDELCFADGRVFLRHSIPQRVDGQTQGRVWSYQDITAFRQAEQRLKEREAALEQTRSELTATLEAIPDLLFELDETGLYLSVHAHDPLKLVVRPEVFLGKRVSDILPAATAAITLSCLREAATTGSSYGQQIRLDLSAGRMWFELSAARKPTVAGQPRRIVVLARDITDRKRSEELIWQQAHLDQLTGLPNRRQFREHLDQALAQARRTVPPTPLGLLFVDLDRFKVINDTHGHDVGDLLLQHASQRLKACVRPTDLVARLGGDEFTLVVQGTNAEQRMQDIAQQVLTRLSQAFVLGEETEYISASVGLTLFPDDGQDSETLVRQADQAMYAAKHAGRNRSERFSPLLQEAALERARIAKDLRVALAQGQLHVVYQPIVDLRTGDTRKAEALLRWQHPEKGAIGPAVFIPVAEEYGLVHDLGEWVFEQAAQQAQAWRRTLHPDFQISVNKSPVQFRVATAACRNWGDHLAQMGLAGDSIAVEITEGLLMEATDTARAHLRQLSEGGLHLVLDDFGTGYSALSYLHQYELDVLKIDRAFVKNLSTAGKDLALCKATIVMAHELGMQVVAEGIETAEQQRLLAAAGCDFGQGYWFSHPLPPQELERWWASRGHSDTTELT